VKINEVIHKDKIVSEVYSLENIPKGLTFLSDEKSFVQFGTWNYEKGKILDAHYHNNFERTSTITQEIVLVLKGKILCNLYTKDKKLIKTLTINKNQFIVQYSLVHEYEILDDSIVLEMKNGPYFGPDIDRTRV